MQPHNIDVLAPKPEASEFLGSPLAKAIHPWWKTRKYIIASVALVVVIVLALIGGLVGSNLHKTDTGSSSNPDHVSSSNPVPSPSATPVLWNVRVNKQSDNSVIGFLDKSSTVTALTTNPDSYLKVSLDGLSSPFNIIMFNGVNLAYIYLGWTVALPELPSIISVPSHNYLILMATNRTDANSTPSKPGNGWRIDADCESAVWIRSSSANQELNVQWINPDGSRAAGILWHWPNLFTHFEIVGTREDKEGGYEVVFTLVPV